MKNGIYLGDSFLNRVKRAYRFAVDGFCGPSASLWGQINERQQPVHTALLASDNNAIRAIFSNPVGSDLFYGVDNLCRSIADEWKSNSDASPYAALLSRGDIAKLAEAHA